MSLSTRLFKQLTFRNALLSGAIVLIPSTFLGLRANYHAYLANGRGGLPYNVIGWMIQWAMRLVAKRDVTSTACYNDQKRLDIYGKQGQERFLRDLPQRPGGREEVLPWVAPHRQKTPNDPDVRELQRQEFNTIARANPDTVQVKTSRAEKHEDALWLHESIPLQPWAAKTNKGECAHIHLAVDGSSHVTLSLADAKEVVSKNWGERHGLSGVIMPFGFTLLYAPRDEEEVLIMGDIFRAGVKFMAGGDIGAAIVD